MRLYIFAGDATLFRMFIKKETYIFAGDTTLQSEDCLFFP